MISDLSIVMLTLARWDGPYSSTSYSLAKEFSRTTKVYCVDSPLTLKDLFSLFTSPQIRRRVKYKVTFKRFSRLSDNLVIIYPSMVLPINFLPKGKVYRILSKVNSYLVFTSVRRALKHLDVNRYIYINSFNPFYHHTNQISPDLFVYHTVDDIRLSPYVKKHGGWREPQMVESADLTFTTSLRLKSLNDIYSKNVFYLPNAADYTLFVDKPKHKPEELLNIKGEIIIFTGHLDWRTDLDLLISIPKYHKSRTLVIVGPVSLSVKDVDRLKNIENVMLVDSKPIAELSGFLHYSDCAIIPFLKNELTESIYPLKVNEYLATGIPVVATPFSEDLKNFSDVISLATSHDAFNNCIDAEINFNKEEKRVERQHEAQKNTWTSRVEQFWKVVRDHLPKS